jgi:hypothetical protein
MIERAMTFVPGLWIPLDILEIPLALVATVAIGAFWLLARDRLQPWTERLRRLTHRAWIWIILAALLGPCIRLVLLPRVDPRINDDYSHLLVADTLVHGRLANPPHPFARHFETLHIMQSPAYASKYPLGFGAALAVGQLITGQPSFGNWLVIVMMCGTLAWLFYRWLPPEVAAAGAVLVTFRWGMADEWVETYTSGALPAIGGALLLGSLPWLVARFRRRDAIILMLGWALIWFTRPYAAVWVAAVVAGVFAYRLLQSRRPVVWKRFARALPAILVVVAASAAITLAHNHAATGNAFLLPYQHHQQIYGTPHPLVWQDEIPEPANLTDLQRGMFRWQRDRHRKVQTLAGRWEIAAYDLKRVRAVFLPTALTLALFIGLALAVRGRMKWPVLFVLGGFAWALLYPAIRPQYLGTYFGPFLLIVIAGLGALARWRIRALPIGAVLAIFLSIWTIAFGPRSIAQSYISGRAHQRFPRAQIVHNLEQSGGRHLIFVRYRPDRSIHEELIFNSADIDNSQIVWAIDLGPESNNELIEHLGDRRVWLVEPSVDMELRSLEE